MTIDPKTAFEDVPPSALTPDPILYVLTQDEGAALAVELSHGQGLDGEDLYGVNARMMCLVHGWEPMHGLAHVFYDQGEAQGYIMKLGEVVTISTPTSGHVVDVQVAS